MKSVKVFSGILVIYIIFFTSVYSHKIPQVDEDEEKCAENAINVLSADDFGNLPNEFTGKSDNDKIIALFNETLLMMQNGDSVWKSFEKAVSIKIKQLDEGDGDTHLHEKIEKMTKSYFDELGFNLTKCLLFMDLSNQLKKAQEAIGKQVGASKSFLPMVKHMILSADLKNQQMNDIPGVVTAAGFLSILGLSNDIIEMFTDTLSSPEI